MHPEQQRAEVLARLPRLGPAADDELLLLQLDLPPRGRAASRLVRRRGVLDDEPFPSFFHRPRMHRRRVVRHLLADADRVLVRLDAEGRSKSASSRARRSVSGRRVRSSLPSRRMSKAMNTAGCASSALEIARPDQVHAPLQALEAGRPAVFVERDDLAVEHERPVDAVARRFERRDDRGKLDGLLVAVARPDVDPRRLRPASTSTSARMPSVLRLVDQGAAASAARRPGSRASGAATRTYDAMPRANSIEWRASPARPSIADLRYPSGWRLRSKTGLAALFGSLELRVLEAVWRRGGERHVRDIQAEFPGAAYTTLMTTMDRLHRKGVLARRKVGRGVLYGRAARASSSSRVRRHGRFTRCCRARAPSRSSRSSSKK